MMKKNSKWSLDVQINIFRRSKCSGNSRNSTKSKIKSNGQKYLRSSTRILKQTEIPNSVDKSIKITLKFLP